MIDSYSPGWKIATEAFHPRQVSTGKLLRRAEIPLHFMEAKPDEHIPENVAIPDDHAFFLALSHAAFWVWVAPVNEAMAPLTPETLPADWMDLRNQWEYAHAARALLQLVGLGALVFSLLVEIPAEVSSGNEGAARSRRD